MTEIGTLDGETAIITGSSSGIGRATAHRLAQEGANVVLAARRRNRLDALAQTLESEYDATAVSVPTDVTDEDAVRALVDATIERFDSLDVVVSNAGVARGSDTESMTTDEYRTMMDVNCDGMFFVTRETLPHLRESAGTLVMVGSFAGQYPRPFNPVYAATKWWTRGFALSVAAAVGDEGVAVSVVNPSEVRTEFGSSYGESFEERFDEGEVTEPEEVAEAIAFAARQEGSMTPEIDVYRRDKLSFF